MPTYYEILKITPTASQPEVEGAIDAQYNKWRRLVTHHDPSIVDEANRSLRTLELIRNTLGIATERSKYDASLNVGGLADPDQLLRTAIPLPQAPIYTGQPSFQQANVQRIDAWICAKCKNANPIGEKFCAKCGNQISDDCPLCNALTELTKQFCSKCGADKAEILAQKNQEKIKGLQTSLRILNNDIREIERLGAKIPFPNFDKNNSYLHQQIWAEDNSGVLYKFLAVVIPISVLLLSIWLSLIVGSRYGFLNGFITFFPTFLIGALLITFFLRKYQKTTIVRSVVERLKYEKHQQITQIQQQINQIQSGGR